MVLRKDVMLSALFVSMTAFAGVGYSATQNGGTPTTPTTPAGNNGAAPVVTQPIPGDRDDVKFECEFFGVFAGKTSGSLRCEARGKLDPKRIEDFFFTPGDKDDFLRFTCRDRDDKPYYSDGITYGIAPAIVDADGDNGDGRLFNTIITGVKTTSPIIVIQNLNVKHLSHDGSSESSDEHGNIERLAGVSFNWFGAQVQIPGVCRLKKHHHGD